MRNRSEDASERHIVRQATPSNGRDDDSFRDVALLAWLTEVNDGKRVQTSHEFLAGMRSHKRPTNRPSLTSEARDPREMTSGVNAASQLRGFRRTDSSLGPASVMA